MAFPSNTPDNPGPVALGLPSLASNLRSPATPRSSPLSKATSLPSPLPESGHWLRLIDQAEASMHEQFQQLRNSFGQSNLGLLPAPQSRESDRKAVEQLLQVEREQMAQQRAQEQEQLRATMQQLADAWLRLEHEQLAVAGHRIESLVSGTTASSGHPGECSTSDSPWWTSNELNQHSTSLPSALPAGVPRGPAEVEAHQRSVAVGFADATTNEEMFHRLRVDLKRHNK